MSWKTGSIGSKPARATELMGAQLVSEVLTRWVNLPDRAFRVLIRMAHTALDKPQNGQPAGVYFGGRELLDATLRPTKASPQNRYRDLKRAIADLVEAGAIERVGSAGPRHNQVYRLTLTAATEWGTVQPPHSIDEPLVDNQSVDNEKGGSTTPPVGDSTTPPVGGSHRPEWGGPQPPPRNHEEPIEELSEEQHGISHTELAVTRATNTDANPRDSPNDGDCPNCGVMLDPDGQCRHRDCTGFVAAVIPLHRRRIA